MKLLIDMNLSPRWVDVLVAGGFEAAHWSSVGRHDAPDAAIFDFAEVNGYVVLTHDLDFGAILASHKGVKPSVVQIRAQNVDPRLIGAPISSYNENSRRPIGRSKSTNSSTSLSAPA